MEQLSSNPVASKVDLDAQRTNTWPLFLGPGGVVKRFELLMGPREEFAKVSTVLNQR